MIIFKITFHLDEKIHDEALEYIKKVYAPRAVESGVVYMPQLSRLLVKYEEVGGSYVLQFRVKSKDALEKWLESDGGALEEDFYQHFGEQVCCFVTLQKRVEM